jgi:chemotaxis protein MotB
MRGSAGHSRLSRLNESSEGVDSEGSWAISYGDMVTLLLAFFVLFFSTNREASQNEGIQAALLAKLGSIQGSKPSAELHPEPQLDIGNSAVGSGIDEQVVKAWGGVARAVGSRIVVEFPEISFFNLARTELTREGKDALSRFTQLYVAFAGRNLLGIKAFTDTVAVDREKSRREGRKFDDNLELSAMRSISAMRALQQAGIPLDRMKISGYGELREEMPGMVGRALASKAGASSKGNPLSRKIVLVIEPETKGKL